MGSSTRLRLIFVGLVLLQAVIICAAAPASPGEGGAANGVWAGLVESLERPCVFFPIIAWAVIFTLTAMLFMTLGFGPAGVVAGSTAAAFQSWMYGGFTPAAGVFATLTSMAMLGYAKPASALISAVIASLGAWLTWELQGCPGVGINGGGSLK